MVRVTLTYSDGDYERFTLDVFGEAELLALPGTVNRVVVFDPFRRKRVEFSPSPLGWFAAEQTAGENKKYSFFYRRAAGVKQQVIRRAGAFLSLLKNEN